MGSTCCSQSNKDKSTLSYTSQLSLSTDQEMPIQHPTCIRIQQNPRFDKSVFCSSFPSIEMQVSDPMLIEYVSYDSASKQLKTIQNILQVMNGQGDSILENKKENNHQQRKSKAKRVQMEDLEKIF